MFCRRKGPCFLTRIMLNYQDKEKEKKYCKPCENQRRHFTPFVVSTDGMFGFEARAFLKRLAKLLAEEWEKPYSIVRGFINARMSIALVRATNRCIRGSRTPASNMSNRFRWEGCAGLGHLKSDNQLETLHIKQYLKIQAEFPIQLIQPNDQHKFRTSLT